MGKARTKPAPTPSPKTSRAYLIIPVLIVLLGFASYSNSLHGEFVLDDKRNIETDIPLRTLWPTRKSMLGPPWTTFTGRPLAMFTFALGYRIHGVDPFGYHVVNIIVHVLSGLALWGVLRRTLRLPILHADCESCRLARGRHCADLGLSSVVQRFGELHFATRRIADGAAVSADNLLLHSRTGRKIWFVAAVISCFLGLATKEPMASAPLFVLLFDRTLVAGSFAQALRQRRWLYIGLVATWVPFFALLSLHPHGADVALSFPDLSSLDYLKTQAWALVRYLRLCFWPTSLVLYYGRANESVYVLRRFVEYAPYGIVILILLGLTVWSFAHNKPAFLTGAWFFLILAPSSTIIAMPTEMIAEYRMYLPLISVIVLTVFAVDFLMRKLRPLPLFLAIPIVVALMLATRERNRDYATTLSMWQDIADKTPGNVVALTNLGMMKYMAGNHPKAEVDFRKALALNPKSGAAYAGLGMLLEAQGRFPEAAEQFRRAIEYEPLSAEAYLNLAMVLANQHKYDEAVDALTPAVEKIPWEQDAAILQGAMMLRAGRTAQGRDRLDRAIAADFDHAHAAQRAGQILIQLNLPESAIDYFQLAAQLSSKDPQTYLTLAMLLTQQGKMSQAMEQYRKVLQFLPDNQAALNNLAWYHATSPNAAERNGQKAVQYALRAVELTQHQNAGALDTLAAAYAESGQFDQAQKAAEQAISLAQILPDNPATAEMKQRLELYRMSKPFRDQTIHPATQGS